MPWSSPATWSAGQVIGAADLNTQLRDNLSYLCVERPKAWLIRTGTSNYSTTSTTFTDVDAANLILTLSNVQSGRVLVIASFLLESDSNPNSNAEVDIIMDSVTRVGGTHGLARMLQSGRSWALAMAYFTGVSVGSHTFKLQYRNVATPAAASIYNNGFPILMWATEC